MKVEFEKFIGDYTGIRFDISKRPESITDSDLNRVRSTMVDYLDQKIAIPEFVAILSGIGKHGLAFHFVLNHQIDRLLLSDGNYKIILSGPNDAYEHGIIKDKINAYPRVRRGFMRLNESSLSTARKTLSYLLPGKKLIGVQGLAAFPSRTSRGEADNLLRRYLSRFNPEEYAVLRSGDMMGSSKLAHNAANDLGFDTVAVIPKAFKPMILPQNAVHIFEEGEDWGEGSHIFGGLPEEILFLGGGFWTYLEYKQALRHDRRVRLGVFPGALYTEEFRDNIPKNWIW